jgi:hypothetical protein
MVIVNFPPAGRMSGWRTNHWAGPSVAKSKLDAHTCTVLPASPVPPAMVKAAR